VRAPQDLPLRLYVDLEKAAGGTSAAEQIRHKLIFDAMGEELARGAHGGGGGGADAAPLYARRIGRGGGHQRAGTAAAAAAARDRGALQAALVAAIGGSSSTGGEGEETAERIEALVRSHARGPEARWAAEAEEEEALVKALVANEVMEDMLADTALEVAIVLSERRELWARAADAAAAAQ
jgi:hypothetical protein